MAVAARWANRASLVLLCAAAAVVAGAGIPAALHGAVPPEGRVTAPGASSAKEPSIHDLRNDAPSNPHFLLDEDENRVTDLERAYPNGMWPGRHQRTDRLQPEPGDDSAARTGGPAGGRLGITTMPMLVRKEASETAPPIAALKANEAVIVLTVTRTWMRVVVRGSEATVTGWVPQAGVTIPWH